MQGGDHPSSIPSHSESTIPARALAPSDGLALAHAGLAVADGTKTNGLVSAHSALRFLLRKTHFTNNRVGEQYIASERSGPV